VKEIRIHGRGGQGVVLAAELLAMAALEDDSFGQAFPAFGGERRGAPVQAFVRLDVRPIRLRYRVGHPDYIVILDPSLVDMLDVLHGLKPGGLVLINSEKSLTTIAVPSDALIYSVPATRIAFEVFGQPFVNPAMLGALAAASGEVSLPAIQRAFRLRFPGELGEKNSLAARWAHDLIREGEVTPVKLTTSHRPPRTTPMWEDSPGLGAPGRPLYVGGVVAPRTSLAYPTGAWRYSRPVLDEATCSGCGLCEAYCPDGCVLVVDGRYVVDYAYCKGCGICAHECPVGAIHMIDEES
jgi:pyruvate ferredoxin oxidoreductase gamma subunit